MAIEQRSSQAFNTYPVTGPATGPTRLIDTTTGGARITLSGTAFSAQVQISNAQARTVPEHLFVPAESDWETYTTISAADVPAFVSPPVRMVRVVLVSGTLTGGDIAESTRVTPMVNDQVVQDYVSDRVAVNLPGEVSAQLPPQLAAQVQPVKDAIGNTTLTQLTLRRQVDGPQFVDGSRWTWSASGTANGGTVIAASGGGYWVREWAGVILAEWWGVRGNLGTDQSAALQAAIDYAASVGGALIRLPVGTILCNVTIKNRVGLIGAGWYATILKSAPGSNKDVIKGQNFDTLSSGAAWPAAPGDGVNGVTLRDLMIDGNRLNNSTGWGIQLWGRSHTWDSVIVRNCASGGIHTRYSTHGDPTGSAAPDEYALESVWRNIKCLGNTGDGWLHEGPHDSKLHEYVAFGNTGCAFRSTRGANWSGGIGGSGWNSWLNGNSFSFGSDVSGLTDIIASGPYTGVGIELAANSGSARIVNFISGGHETGVILRGSNHMLVGQISDCRNVAGTAGVGLLVDGAVACDVNLVGTGNYRVLGYGAAGSYGANRLEFRMAGLAAGGDGIPGNAAAIQAQDEVLMLINGQPGKSFVRVPMVEPGVVRLTNGWRPVWPDSNGVMLTDTDTPTTTRKGPILARPNPTLTSTNAAGATPIAAEFNALRADVLTLRQLLIDAGILV